MNEKQISQLTIRFHHDPGSLLCRYPGHGEDGALGAFQLHMKIARGITASPAILGRANKWKNK